MTLGLLTLPKLKRCEAKINRIMVTCVTISFSVQFAKPQWLSTWIISRTRCYLMISLSMALPHLLGIWAQAFVSCKSRGIWFVCREQDYIANWPFEEFYFVFVLLLCFVSLHFVYFGLVWFCCVLLCFILICLPVFCFRSLLQNGNPLCPRISCWRILRVSI